MSGEESSPAVKNKNIEWSIEPVITFGKLCGIPAFTNERKEWRNRGYLYQRIISYSFHSPIFLCLYLNSFFNIYNLVRDIKTQYVCLKYESGRSQMLRNVMNEIANAFRSLTETFLHTGIPITFAFCFYYTQRFQKIFSVIRMINKEKIAVLSRPSFIQKCRRHCLIFIVISFTV